jgi:hypothetical protein
MHGHLNVKLERQTDTECFVLLLSMHFIRNSVSPLTSQGGSLMKFYSIASVACFVVKTVSNTKVC